MRNLSRRQRNKVSVIGKGTITGNRHGFWEQSQVEKFPKNQSFVLAEPRDILILTKVSYFFQTLQTLGCIRFGTVAAMATVDVGWKRADEASLAQSLVLLWPAGGAKESSHCHLCRDLHPPL